MHHYEFILCDKADGVATITINRPQVMNALNTHLARELHDALADSEADAGIRVILITGAGDKAFSAGADVGELQDLTPVAARDFSLTAQSLTHRLERLPKPVIARIDGLCLGAGLELAMSCDLRIASDKALFGQPETNLGIMPGMGGTQRLTRLIGKSKSMEMNMLGDNINAQEAYRLGLVNRIVPSEELDAAVGQVVKKLMAKSAVALGQIKKAVTNGSNMDLDRALFYEAECFGASLSTEDAREGMQAFLEKRKPQFKGS